MLKNHNPGRPRIVLFQPDIPGNTGTILRLAACLDLNVDVIEPAGFRLDNKSLLRSGMDYLERAKLRRHDDWEAFEAWRKQEGRRAILLTTKSDRSYQKFDYRCDDCLIFGRESSGAPKFVHEKADTELTIPMAEAERSLNVAMSVAMVCSEVLRHLGQAD